MTLNDLVALAKTVRGFDAPTIIALDFVLADTAELAQQAGLKQVCTWLQQVEETRHQGFGVDEGNYIAGVTVLAAPVWKAPGKPSHALVAIGIGSALKRNGLEELEAALLSAARALTRQLGGDAG